MDPAILSKNVIKRKLHKGLLSYFTGFVTKVTCFEYMNELANVQNHRHILTKPVFKMSSSNYDPELEFYAQIIIDVNVGISMVIFPLIIYLILTQSKILKNYKWYLLNSVICCQLYEFFVFMFIPNFLVSSTQFERLKFG
jgi:hypothetical protein